MKKFVIVALCIFMPLIGYKVYLNVRSEPYADESVAFEVYELLRSNGYDVFMEDEAGHFNSTKTFVVAVQPQLYEGLEFHEMAQHPEVFFFYIHLYSSENDAIIKTGQFSPKGDIYLNDGGGYRTLGYHTAPRYYQSRNAIIQYLGVDLEIKEMLDDCYGMPFAG